MPIPTGNPRRLRQGKHPELDNSLGDRNESLSQKSHQKILRTGVQLEHDCVNLQFQDC